jgi:predicted RecB family endonuclease
MNKFKALSVFGSLNMALCYGVVDTQTLIDKSVNEMRGVNDQVIMLIGEELKYRNNPYEFAEITNLYQKENILTDANYRGQQRISDFQTTFENIQKKYDFMDQMITGTEIRRGIIKGVVKAGLAGVAAATSGGVGFAVGLSIAETINENVVDNVLDGFNERVGARTSQVVASILREKLGEEKEYLLRDLTPESAKEIADTFALQDHLESYFSCSDQCSDVEKEKAEMMKTMALENLSNIVKGNKGAIEGLKNSLNATQAQVDESFKMIDDLASKVTEIKSLTSINSSNISLLQENQNDINNRLNQLTGKVQENSENIKKNSNDILFLKDFLYAKMSPKEKMLALNAGVYGQNFTEEKKELIRLQGKFEQNVGDLLNGANQVIGIAQNLGIGLPKEFEDIISKGNTAYQAISGAITSYASGNYLGAVASLSSMFAKRRDAGAERHAQVMRALGIINQKLDVVLSNQQQMINNQIQMMKNQEEIYSKLVKIEETIIDLSAQLYNQVYLARVDIRYNREALLELVTGPYRSCISFIFETKRALRFGYKSPYPRSPYDIRKSYFNKSENRETFKNCAKLKEQLMSVNHSGEYTSQFKLGMQSSDNTVSNAKYITEYYNSLLNLYDQVVPLEARDRTYVSGLVPVSDVKTSESLYNYEVQKADVKLVFDSPEWLDSNFGRLDIDSLLREPLDFESIIKTASVVNDIYFYLDIVQDGRMLDLENLIEEQADYFYSSGYQLLSGMKTHLNMALIQASLLSGQLFIPELYKKLENKVIIPSLNDVLSKSNVVKDNFLAYLIFNKELEYGKKLNSQINRNSKKKKMAPSSSFSDPGFTSFSNYGPYEIFLKKKNEKKLNEVLGVNDNSIYRVKCADKCMLHIGEKVYDLPPKAAVNSGRFILHPDTKQLMTMKSLTTMNMSTYTMAQELKFENELDFKNYRLLLLKSANSVIKNPKFAD